MSRSLNRLLKLKRMTEEIGKAELSREAEKLSAIERALNASAAESRSCREDAFSAIRENRGEDWLLATGGQELAEWRIRGLSVEHALQGVCVEESRARFMECRKEKYQLETLVENENKAEKVLAIRQDQSSLDSWFERRKSLKNIL